MATFIKVTNAHNNEIMLVNADVIERICIGETGLTEIYTINSDECPMVVKESLRDIYSAHTTAKTNLQIAIDSRLRENTNFY